MKDLFRFLVLYYKIIKTDVGLIIKNEPWMNPVRFDTPLRTAYT